MRIVLHNPHTLWYKRTVGSVITSRRSVDKYEPFFDYLYNKTEKLCVFLDNSSFTKHKRFYKIPVLFNFFLWTLINRLNIFKFDIFLNSSSLEEDHLIFTFIYENFTNETSIFTVPRKRILDNFRRMKCLKAVHLSHYGYNTNLGSENCRYIGLDYFVAENNLYRNSDFFNCQFNWYQKDVAILPFIPGKRFTVNKAFHKRKNMALATGTLTPPITDLNFVDFFNTDILQPMRLKLYENQDFLKNQVDCMISKVENVNRQKNNFAIKMTAKMRGLSRLLFFLIKKNGYNYYGKDRAYFQSNIVDLYNDYRMFINPEEIINLPAIGFIEGMACGSVYIGLRDKMYMDIGMEDGVHYIGYDGTIEDLKLKIEYYQLHEKELEIIANNSLEFVRHKLNANKVFSNFIDNLAKSNGRNFPN